ncbi:hypothetical protein CAPTEDRAFT_226612 [Capitella teleta]|uniref:Major facilitator superfamily (MFS) profile domain-containing protein n=1 Tax=Capitella teleta TaxID=283909 RepID=R7UMY9_CAPTE|nr:hypothetical protein CAPTEDRAFT_226612 [Capitella teleta]|eukprot:ELU07909.1 hypothetical protein CAPTEDRAFT_226612 [Capitella teleta]
MSGIPFGSTEVIEVAKSGGLVGGGEDQPAIPPSDDDVEPIGPDDEVDDERLLDPSIEIRRHPTRIIIVEPLMALFMATYVSSQVLTSQFALKLVSVRFNFTSSGNDSCGPDMDPAVYELQQSVQARAAVLMTYFNVCSSVPAIFMVLFWGAYSDRVSRKVPILLAIFGQMIKFTIMVITMTMRANLYLILVGAFVDGIFGGASTVAMSCMAYISDTSTPKDRTIRLTVIEVTCGVCSALSQVLVGFGITNYGFIIPLYVLIACHALNSLYVIFFVPEIRYPRRGQRFVAKDHIFRTVRLYSTEDGNRKERLICLAALLFCSATIGGRFDPLILNSLNSPLCWSSILLGIYTAWTSLSAQFGGITLVSLLFRRIGEMGVGIIGCLSGIVYFSILAFCHTTLSMFLVVLAGVGSFAPVPMIRALKSKLTAADQQGALFAGSMAMETFCSLIGSTVFNTIYSATVADFSGAVFLVMGGFELCGLVFVIVLAVLMRRRQPIELITSVQADEPIND